TQIQQRALLDGRAHAHRLHQAMGEVRFSGLAVTGVGAANEHARRVPRDVGEGNREIYFMALHILPLQNPQTFRQFFMPNQAETGRIPQILAKMGWEVRRLAVPRGRDRKWRAKHPPSRYPGDYRAEPRATPHSGPEAPAIRQWPHASVVPGCVDRS